MTVYRGLDHGIRGGHFAVHSFLSGVLHSEARDRKNGNVTIDQYLAEKVGNQTRFPSLTVGYRMFFEQVYALEKECDMHIIGGDLFDRLPNMEELELYFSFIRGVKIPTIMLSMMRQKDFPKK